MAGPSLLPRTGSNSMAGPSLLPGTGSSSMAGPSLLPGTGSSSMAGPSLLPGPRGWTITVARGTARRAESWDGAQLATVVGPSCEAPSMEHGSSANGAALDGLLTTQHRVVARSQALAAGMTEAALRHRIRDGGPWQVLLPGVYLAVTGTSTVAQRHVAAVLYAGPASVVTGAAALRRYGIRTPATGFIDVLVPVQRRRSDSGFVRLHRTARMPSPVMTDGAVRYAPSARAVADATRLLTSLRDVRAVIADAVQRGKCLPERLADELNQGPVRRSARLRLVLGEIADGIRSTAEADLKDLIKRSRLPEPLFNARLFAGGAFIGAPDCWWPDAGVAAEVDSREWHLSPEDWERTMSRRARMSSHGIIVLHFTPHQIRAQPRQVAGDIRSALQAAAGRSLPITALPAR